MKKHIGQKILSMNESDNITSKFNLIYNIDISLFGISNDNTNATDTTIGINTAITQAKQEGYCRIQLPPGHYAIDTSVITPILLNPGTSNFKTNMKGIVIPNDIELILTDCTLQMIPTADPYYCMISMYHADNSKITGGTIIGDRYDHDYGHRINQNGDELEFGEIDVNTGELIESGNWIRTKDYITHYVDWVTKKPESFPDVFKIMPLEKTKYNVTDGGTRFVYCYDENNNYLGQVGGGNFTNDIILLEGTKKIKVSFRWEDTLDGVYYMTKETAYATHEYGSGIFICASDNVTIQDSIIIDCIGDCICTIAFPINITVDNLKVLNCTLENSRRQGISFVANSENCLIKGCNIGKIHGVDPQCGIDFEHYEYVRDTIIENCNFYDNKKWDIINYNGTYVTVRDCYFEGAIATTYGHNMLIYNNIFEYKDSNYIIKRYPGSSLVLNTRNNWVYNNIFKNGIISNVGDSSVMFNNKFYDCQKVTLTANGSNEFYNSYIHVKNSIDVILENMYFKNSQISCEIPTNKIVNIDNSTFDNSVFYGGGTNIITNSVFNLIDCKFIDSNSSANIIYNQCDIISQANELWWATTMAKELTFNNCNIDCGNGRITNYGTINFNDCNLLFRNKVTNNSFWNASGYGYEKCPWNFTNCTFDSETELRIGGTVTDSTVVKNISFS